MRRDELPTGQSDSPQHPRQTAQQTRPDDASELQLLREAVRQAKIQRARRRALSAHPELAPLADLIEADTPEQYAELAEQLATRLQGDEGNVADQSSQTTGLPVGASSVELEAPEPTDLEELVASGSYAAIARNPLLRAEYRKRYGI
jgi:hypothetical protein